MMHTRPEAIILDFDHTVTHLGDFVRWDDARVELLPLYRACGIPESFLESHEGAMILYRDVAASGLLPDTELMAAQQKASRILESFEAEAVPKTFVLRGATELMSELPDLGLPAGIVTSNSLAAVSAILERDDLGSAFRSIVCRDEVKRLKPSPEGLLVCCARIGVAPDRCVKVGDMAGDIEAARAVGMLAYGVRGGIASDEELREAGAESVFDDVSELLAVLDTSLTE
jgi:N-acetyl-D-muramate 6-phosphate phosphatase